MSSSLNSFYEEKSNEVLWLRENVFNIRLIFHSFMLSYFYNFLSQKDYLEYTSNTVSTSLQGEDTHPLSLLIEKQKVKTSEAHDVMYQGAQLIGSNNWCTKEPKKNKFFMSH